MRILAIITLAVTAISLSACAHKEEAASSSTMQKSSYSK